jgi:hypothetical protein
MLHANRRIACPLGIRSAPSAGKVSVSGALIILLAAFWLTSCAGDPSSGWWKQETSHDQLRHDSAECMDKAKALASVLQTRSYAEVRAKIKLQDKAFSFCLESMGYRRGERDGAEPDPRGLPSMPTLKIRYWDGP